MKISSLAIWPASLILLSSASAFTPVDLKCDGLVNPIAASPQPALTWRIDSKALGVSQSAWQILVAASKEQLDENKDLLWDSGKTAASRNPQVVYAGKAPKTGQTCFWKVRSWDQHGKESPWSEVARFEPAPTTPADWHGARWIDDGKPLPTKDEDFYKPDPAPLFRKEFSLEKPIARARLHVAGIGYGIPSINGERLKDQPLDPPWTNFDKRILFRTHDVTEHLAQGKNCLGLTVGNGWYNPLPLRMWGGRNIRDALPVGRPRGIALLVVEYEDGSEVRIATDDSWQVAEGPTLRNSIFLGEERDGRRIIPGWDKTGFDGSAWKKAHVAEASLDPLQPILDMPPVRRTDSLAAVSITTPIPGVHVVDFGKNFTGIPEIKITAPAGTRIMLRYGELLYPDGTINPMTSVCGQIKGMRKNKQGEESPIGGPGAPKIAWQQDIYNAHGGGDEIFRPDFTFRAFRYLEITGLAEAPALADIRADDLHSDLPDAGSFSCSNDLLNQIQTITRRTFVNNVISVQSDCPHRERFGYGGDICVTSEAFLMNYDMNGFYKNTVRNYAEAARPDGNFTDTAPFVGIQYCGVGWAMTHPLLIEQLYQHYGDKRLIEEQLPAAIRWFDLEASKRKDGLVMTGLGDHEAMPRIAGPVLTTPMFIDTARRMARLCDTIGRMEDAKRLRQMASESAGAWVKQFLDEKTGKIGGGSQSEQVLGLVWGTLLEPAQERVLSFLAADVAAGEGGPALKTGIFGTRFLLEELSGRGRHDIAYSLATRETFPSWGWMLKNGATSLWETWKESDNTFSHNHPMFGSISAWFFRHLGGIQIAEDAVGADRLVIEPKPVAGLEWVKSSHQTIRGQVVSNWKKSEKGSEFTITIPPDTTATVILPTGEKHQIGSGTYQFLVTP